MAKAAHLGRRRLYLGVFSGTVSFLKFLEV
jgi:hypothetical protein